MHGRRHGYQYSIGAAARLQPEERTAILQQVELHIAAATIELILALALTIGSITSAAQDREIRFQIPAGDALHEIKAALPTHADLGRDLIQIVIEEPADATRFAPMAHEEILIATGS